jgi:Na+-transporting NADH:ubiquinone oxidoreductase subunit C
MKTNTNFEKTEVQTKDILLDKVKMVVFMLIVGLIVAGMLAGLASYTKPLVEKNQKLRKMEKVLTSFAIDYSEDNLTEVYKNEIEIVEEGGQEFYKTSNGDIAFMFEGKGLWATINGFIAFKSDMKTLKGISIMSQGETPGLGGRIKEEWFINQFNDLEYKPEIVILKASKTADQPNEVDGIAGATLTGDVLAKILNNNIEEALQQLEVN